MWALIARCLEKDPDARFADGVELRAALDALDLTPVSAATEPRKLALAKGVRYTCKRCGDCCRTLPVPLTPQDVARLDAHDWTATSLGLRGAVVHTAQAPRGVWGPHTARTPDGACVFLAEGNVCEVERTLGRDAKPLACRRYPFAYAPGSEGKLAFVGAEFTCSAVAANSGKPWPATASSRSNSSRRDRRSRRRASRSPSTAA